MNLALRSALFLLEGLGILGSCSSIPTPVEAGQCGLVSAGGECRIDVDEKRRWAFLPSLWDPRA
jgi:hypothetical protein